ncbi:hypothetical protein GBA52_025042 [Prunus armeniaca]|nr:hypothetical protein GBA52_025042 [Prunus armeniaca]
MKQIVDPHLDRPYRTHKRSRFRNKLPHVKTTANPWIFSFLLGILSPDSSTKQIQYRLRVSMANQVADHLEPWRDLHGKVVMVTGASSGLGREFCLDLAKAGCRIVAAARRIDRLQSVCDEINQPTVTTPSSSSSSSSVNGPGSSRAVAVELDISADGLAIEKSVNKAWDAFGASTPSLTMPVLEGPGWCQNMFLHACADADQGGSIINVSSIAGLHRGYLPGAVAYNCSKAGVKTPWQRLWLWNWGVHKIRVNAISPGLFRSEITEGLMKKRLATQCGYENCPLRTYGTSDPALTSLVRYLVHDSSEYVSGNVYIVDAGATLPGVPIFSALLRFYVDYTHEQQKRVQKQINVGRTDMVPALQVQDSRIIDV